MNNLITTWAQGRFIDQPQYRNWPESEKQKSRESEKLLVRPAPLENAICRCADPESAEWVANRLNLAAKLEQMTYDFATGKTDGSEIIELVKSSVNN